jgi:ribosomal protein L40E
VIVCQLCGAENSPDAHFCYRCDARLTASAAEGAQFESSEPSRSATMNTRPCPRCGTLNGLEMQYCSKCDRELSDVPLIRQEVFGSRRQSLIGCLTIMRSSGRPTTGRCPLHGPDAVVGCYDSDIFGRDPYLTPRHVSFRRNGQRMVVQDLGSFCGTYVRVNREKMVHADVFRVGRELLRFVDYEHERTRAKRAPDFVERLRKHEEYEGEFWGELVILAGISPQGDRVMLRSNTITIGRTKGDIIFSQDTRLSRSHARLTKTDYGMLLEDLSSRRGTFVRLAGEREVPFGTELIVGETRLRVDLPEVLDDPELLKRIRR